MPILGRFAVHSVQARKSWYLCGPGVFGNRCFDSVAEPSELSNHLCCVPLLRLLGNGWAPFFVPDSWVQDQPDQPALSVSDGPDGLIVSQSRDAAAIENLEDASFGLDCRVGRLVKNASHVAVALRRPVAVVDAGALFVAGAGTDPRGETFLGRKGCGSGTDFGNDLLR